MYLKEHERLKDGKRYVYYSLTESLRVSRKRVVQRTVLHLGINVNVNGSVLMNDKSPSEN